MAVTGWLRRLWARISGAWDRGLAEAAELEATTW